MADLLPGDLLLTHSKGFVGALIRFGENVRYHGWRHAFAVALGIVPEDRSDPCWANHVAVYVGNGQVIEALGRGLQLSSIEKYELPGAHNCAATPCIVAPLELVQPGVLPIERKSLVDFAREQLARHDRYGWLSIASIVLQLLTPSKLDVSYDGALICSAFGGQCWEHAGVILPTRSSLTTMPADLAAMVDHSAEPLQRPAAA